MAPSTKLSILITGPNAKEIYESALGIILPDDDVQISESKADIVIGTNCIRTYPNTSNFLSVLIKKIRSDKKLLEVPKVKKAPKKKKSTKKKAIVEAVNVVKDGGASFVTYTLDDVPDACKTLETLLEETNLTEINDEKL